MNTLISSKEIILKKNHTYDNALNICYCFDDNYTLGAGVSLTSLVENNKNHNIIAHMFVLSLSADNEQTLIELANTYAHLSIIIYKVNNTFDISSENKKKFPLSAALRILVPKVLNDQVSKILYLDCDTLVCNDISSLFCKETNAILIAIRDTNEKQHLDRLGLNLNQYFNSGVMLMQTKQWHEYNVTDKLIDLLNKEHYAFPDQDALNIILNEHVTLASAPFNHQIHLASTDTEDPDTSVIIHYLGADKPWFTLFITDTYKHYFKLSPWRNTKLKQARHARRIKVLASKMRKTNKIKSFKLYLQYRFYKLFNIK